MPIRTVGAWREKSQCGRGQGRSVKAGRGIEATLVLAGFSLKLCYV